jgi:hypothetical protein
MQTLPTMITPSSITTAAFVAIVAGLASALVLAVRHASRALGESAAETRSAAARTVLALSAWLALTGAISASGLLTWSSKPPLLPFFALLSLAVPVLVARSSFGARLVHGLPIAALVGVQAFRLPLELVLHAWKNQGVLPVQMTFEGHNFDIVTGVLAAVCGAALCLYPQRVPRAAIWLFNCIGSGLLLAVTVIALLSSPLPIRQYLNDPPLLLAFYFPYGWILPFCIGGALFGHLLVFRWLLAGSPVARHAGPGSRDALRFRAT